MEPYMARHFSRGRHVTCSVAECSRPTGRLRPQWTEDRFSRWYAPAGLLVTIDGMWKVQQRAAYGSISSGATERQSQRRQWNVELELEVGKLRKQGCLGCNVKFHSENNSQSLHPSMSFKGQNPASQSSISPKSDVRGLRTKLQYLCTKHNEHVARVTNTGILCQIKSIMLLVLAHL